MSVIIPSGRNYIPGPDAQFDVWFRNFNLNLVAITASSLGVSTAVLTAVSSAYTAWAAAYAEANNPDTRTSPIIAAKAQQRKIATETIRNAHRSVVASLRNLIQLTPPNEAEYVSWFQQLGLKVPDPTRTPSKPPSEGPLLNVIVGTDRKLKCKYEIRDTVTPGQARDYTRKAKPLNVVACQVAVQVSNVGTFVNDYTRTPFEIRFADRCAGQACSMRGRWLSGRGQHSDWGNEVIFTIPSSSPYQPQARQLPAPAQITEITSGPVRGLISGPG